MYVPVDAISLAGSGVAGGLGLAQLSAYSSLSLLQLIGDGSGVPILLAFQTPSKFD